MRRAPPTTTRLVLAASSLFASSVVASGAAAQDGLYEGEVAGAYLAVPMQTFRDRQYARVVPQAYDFSCGAAATATLLTYHYGLVRDERAVFAEMWTAGEKDAIRERGFSLLDMKRYLQANGLRADGFTMPLETIEEIGIPGIALIDVDGYKHFVVVKGALGDRVLLGDPARGLVARDRAEFLDSWDGTVLFVRSFPERGKAAWNLAADWAAHPEGQPLDGLVLREADERLLDVTRPLDSPFGLGTLIR